MFGILDGLSFRRGWLLIKHMMSGVRHEQSIMNSKLIQQAAACRRLRKTNVGSGIDKSSQRMKKEHCRLRDVSDVVYIGFKQQGSGRPDSRVVLSWRIGCTSSRHARDACGEEAPRTTCADQDLGNLILRVQRCVSVAASGRSLVHNTCMT